MEIELDMLEDIEKINKSFLPRLKTWQYAVISVTVILAIIMYIYITVIKKADNMFYISVIMTVIPGYVTVYKKQGLDFIEYMKYRKCQKLFSVS